MMAPLASVNLRLERLVNHYQHQFGPRRRAERQRYAGMPDLQTAIQNAALARRPDGKCESHQRRIGLARLRAFEQALQGIRSTIGGCQSFGELHETITEHRTAGIGPLAVYDTAARIGAHLGLAPKKVHLHAGTHEGARALGLDTSAGYLRQENLPSPIRRLSVDEIEDFLCIYKGSLRGRSWPRGCDPGHGARRPC